MVFLQYGWQYNYNAYLLHNAQGVQCIAESNHREDSGIKHFLLLLHFLSSQNQDISQTSWYIHKQLIEKIACVCTHSTANVSDFYQ